MTYQEKIRYYDNRYAEEGLPEGMTTLEFFTQDVIQGIIELSYKNFYVQDFITLLKEIDNQETITRLVHYFVDSNFGFIGSIENLANDKIASEILIENVVKIINNENVSFRYSNVMIIFKNEKLTELFLQYPLLKPNNITGIIFNFISEELAFRLLKRPDYVECFLHQDSSYFFSFIDKYQQESGLQELVVRFLNKYNFTQKINLLEKKYNPETNEPWYLQSLYQQFSKNLKDKKIRDRILSIIKNPSEENKKEIKEMLADPEVYNIFLTEILEPTFTKIVEILDLSKSIYEERREQLYQKLQNYEVYEPTVVKDILCIYSFNDISNNIRLRLKTIIEYSQTKSSIMENYKDQLPYINRLYNFLTSKEITDNPIELISNLNINEIIRDMHSVFSSEINQKSDISDILATAPKKQINGVSVIDTDIPLDRSYFLIHSIGYEGLKDDPLSLYKQAAEKHNRICTSILDNNHSQTFLNGVVLGYCNIKAPLYSAIPCDGQTNQRSIKSGYSQYRSVLSGVDRFLHRTINTYNELTYETNNELIMPSYVLVIDKEPSDKDFLVAKSFNIPILIYHTKKVDYEYEPILLKEEFDYDTNTLDYIEKSNQRKLSI